MFSRVEESAVPSTIPAVRERRIACILDEFSMAGFEHEAIFQQLTPTKWLNQLEEFQPELLLIESAWRGKDNLWTNSVARCGPEILGIIDWCKRRNIPTAFWNKEDPVHFTTFLHLASQFDYVFTTDLDSVPRYQQLLGHNRVQFFPFAAQTRIHNPIAKFNRADAFAFAGSYYSRYPERTRALESFVSELLDHKPMLIFDRNFGTSGTQHEDYRFPDSYKDLIVGRLEPSEIEYAYKGFTTGINLNSVASSQTMLARRVYELLASNTLVVSNYSRSLEILFGDLVIAADRGNAVSQRLKKLSDEVNGEAKIRAQALRKVLKEHTYNHRVNQLFDAVGLSTPSIRHRVGVLAVVENETDMEVVLEAIDRQSRKPDKVIITTRKTFARPMEKAFTVYALEDVRERNLHELYTDIEYLALFNPKDYYGPHYLQDLVLSREYANTPVVSKSSPEVQTNAQNGSPENHGASTPSQFADEHTPYTLTSIIEPRRSMFSFSVLKDLTISDFLNLEANTLGVENLKIDSFEYLREGMLSSPEQRMNSLSETSSEGFALTELHSIATSALPGESDHDLATLSEILDDLPSQGQFFKLERMKNITRVISTLEDETHSYIYTKSKIPLSELPWDTKGQLFFEATPGLDTMFVVLFFDANQNRLPHAMGGMNTNHEFAIPAEAEYAQFGLRIRGPGQIDILNVFLAPRSVPAVGPRTKVRQIILTNIYPSYDDLYRNGFVHSRVVAYQEAGEDFEVVRLSSTPFPKYREFDGVTVLELNPKDLEVFLRNNDIATVFVHFLNQDMYEILSKPDLKVEAYVWIHGSEIQPWWRRTFNSTTPDELEIAKEASALRMELWRKVFTDLPSNFHFIFVSQYFADEVMEDVGIKLPEEKYQVIHNPIDTDMFSYSPKPPEQRTKVLSIRPYASRKYANDLSVKAVELLSQEPFFAELEFRFIGDGELFDELLAPLSHHENVTIERRFLSHSEIAAIHKEYGILLTPTRMDAQGVSRDEGMSSGLVPITTSVAAIPEFVDSTCGILAPLDDAQALAEGIKLLVKNPELFQEMSQAAARRVRQQSDKRTIIAKELALLASVEKTGRG